MSDLTRDWNSRKDEMYLHKLLQLFCFHAALQLALFRGRETVDVSPSLAPLTMTVSLLVHFVNLGVRLCDNERVQSSIECLRELQEITLQAGKPAMGQ
jgi:hypothetical protein